MGLLGAVSLTTCMLLATLGGWLTGLRSVCASEHWRREVRRVAGEIKTRQVMPSWSLPSRGCHAQGKAWDFKGQLVGSQKGSVELLGILLMLALSSLLVLQALMWRQRHREVQEHFQQTLCLKEAIGETQLLIKKIGLLNSAILAGEVTSWGLVLIGGIGFAAKPSWEKVKKGLQAAQELAWGASFAQLARLQRQGCDMPPSIWPTPYKRGVRLTRTADGRAQSWLHGVWVWSTPLTNYVVRWRLTTAHDVRAAWEIY